MPEVRYVTQYALSEGIEVVEGSPSRHDFTCRTKGSYATRYVPLEHAHRTLDEARAKTEAMRVAKVASLKKQLAKIESANWAPKTKDKRESEGGNP